MHEHFALIDREIVWYGSVNLLSNAKEEDGLMRVKSREIASGTAGDWVPGITILGNVETQNTLLYTVKLSKIKGWGKTTSGLVSHLVGHSCLAGGHLCGG